MAGYIGAIDQGTTSTRFIVFDHAGTIVAAEQMEHRQIMPRPGWVEHDAAEIWANTQTVIAGALARAGLAASDLAAVGITNQRETTLLWDRATGQPVHNALVWMDTRTDALVQALAADGGQDRLRARTGLPLATYFSGLKLRWLLDEVPGARARAEAGELLFGTIDTWLAWNLTGLHITDVTNASRTQLMDLETLDWDAEILALLDIPRACLPQIRSSSEVYGTCRGVLEGVPLAGILGDQQAALFGQACLAPGEAKNTYGTGCFMLMNTGSVAVPSKNKLLTTVAWCGPSGPLPGEGEGWGGGGRQAVVDPSRVCYALEGSVFMAGATVQWLRDGLRIIQSAPEVEPLAASVPDTGDVFLVPAFAGLGAPDWDGRARGTLVGLTRGSTRAHIARAALEAIALQSADIFGAMSRDSGIALTELRVDGGACRNDLLMQLQADLAGVPVVRPRVTETTALGAAYLAGLATGVWSGGDEIAAQWAVDRRFEPRLAESERRGRIARWREAVARARGWAR